MPHLYCIAARAEYSISPWLRRYRDCPRRPAETEEELAETATSGAIELCSRNHVRFHHPGLRIDLGGIAKGFAVDRAIDVLQNQNQSYGLVNAGGDLATFGSSPQTIHIRDPRFPARSLCQVAIANAALASSARLFDPLESSTPCHSSTINPATREPATEIAGTTVRAPSCIVADALTKIVMISGERSGGLLKTYEASALLVATNGDVRITPEWQDVIRASA